jgi:large subunit ribosomal protein L30
VAKKNETTAEPKRIRITQVRSGIGRPATHRATLRALGLRHHQHSIVQQDNPAIRGMIFQVSHLVKIEDVAEGEA